MLSALTAMLLSIPTPATEAFPVHLKFAWPEKVDARVSFTRERTRGGKQQKLTGTYRLASRIKDGQRSVSSEDMKVKGGKLDGASEGLLAAASFPYLVTEDGRFDSLPRAGEVVDKLLATVPRPAQLDTAQFRAMLEKTLIHGVKKEWDSMVGAWVDRSLTPGQVEERREETATPLGEGSITLDVKTVLETGVPCHSGDAKKRCVRLKVTSAAPAEEAKRFATTLIAQVQKLANLEKPQDVQYEAATHLARVELITEAETLLPHRLETQTETALSLTIDGRKQSQSQSQRSEHVFRYR